MLHITDERLARIALSRLIEPQDAVGHMLIHEFGAVAALQLILSADPTVDTDALKRWQPRIPDMASRETDLATMERLGGGVLIPSDPAWPAQLNALLEQRPICLYWRGNTVNGAPDFPAEGTTVAMTGSRDATSYGMSVTGDFAYSLAQQGYTIVSGGAYGIDAAAHRAALAGAIVNTLTPTIAVLAGGVDRFYPSGNEDLLRAVAGQGLVVSELPPGSAPTRYRFLQRNRITAALAGATVIVEARWRSGALNTAAHAEKLARGVGAVPGSVHSANSAGCHRLMREGTATVVTDATEIVELVKAHA